MRIDLHVHTIHSQDSLLRPESILRWASRRHLDALAITDHNTIEGAHQIRTMASIPIIVGEEIMTDRGEIIGLFLQRRIPPDLTPMETVAQIREQSGLVYVPHPMDRLRGSTLEPEALREIVDQIDAIEVLNARMTFRRGNDLARVFARERNLAMGAGSDAHQGFEIGRAYVEMPPFDDAASFLTGLHQGKIHGRVSSPWVHMGSTWARAAKAIATLTSPGE